MTYPATPVLIRGVRYRSMAAAARHLGVHLSTVWTALETGRLDHCGLGRWQPGYLDGVPYPSVTAAARQLGIPPTTLHRHIKTGKRTWVTT